MNIEFSPVTVSENLVSLFTGKQKQRRQRPPRRRPLMRLQYFQLFILAIKKGFGSESLFTMSRSDAVIRFGIGAVKLASENLTPVLIENVGSWPPGYVGPTTDAVAGFFLSLRSDGRYELLPDDSLPMQEYLDRAGYFYTKTGATVARKFNPGYRDMQAV